MHYMSSDLSSLLTISQCLPHVDNPNLFFYVLGSSQMWTIMALHIFIYFVALSNFCLFPFSPNLYSNDLHIYFHGNCSDQLPARVP